ncbi:MAG: sodium-translocating pyrophosphatase [Erysipelothrix sp.]|nr:sodium-translocating pyrophosphatase [Erysipelothrix sp.]
MTMSSVYVFTLLVAAGAFIVAFYFYKWIKQIEVKNQQVSAISNLIAKGSDTFLRKEYSILAKFSVVMIILIFIFLPHPLWRSNITDNLVMSTAYLAGTIFSGLAGLIGMKVATMANARTAEAATKDISQAFMSSFRGGSVMGMAVVGFSTLGVALLFWLTEDTTALLGFSFGASSLALFAKAGGGIFTKAADIAADLTGKVELGIPEDDPRNPAVIADNVGDNVGDCAGMGADLFDSHVASLSAALVMAVTLDKIATNGQNTIMVFLFAALGLLASMIGVLFARMEKNQDPTHALNVSTYTTSLVFFALSAFTTYLFGFFWRLWIATIIGLIVGVLIGVVSDYFTNDENLPVRNVAEMSQTGPAFTILGGMSYGFISVLPALIGIGLASILSFKVAEPLGEGYALFGIAMAAVGMLSIVGMIISNDAYGPIVDNARGIVEMASLGDKALEVTDSLDSAGNTVKAVTKGFSIAAAGLTVISLLAAFMTTVNESAIELGLVSVGEVYLNGFDVMNPTVLFGLLVGTAVPAVFSALLIQGVTKNAGLLVKEIHRQFNEIEGLKEGLPNVVPDYDRVIELATEGALRELIPAGAFAIIMTLAVGLIAGVSAIGGFLVGNILGGLLLALFMSNSGGLWDNAKKYIESGNFGGKGSDAHKASVIGDTVGDPFKDTAGPSINTQITVVSLVASLMASIFLMYSIL